MPLYQNDLIKKHIQREAFTIVVSESGAQFDPDLVRIFMKTHKKFYSGIELRL